MAWGVNSVLNMGVGALSTSQSNIQTTGNNISNVDTVGYSRQAVRQQDKTALNHRVGQVGQGVQATEVIRYFDAFIESNYLDKLSTSQRWESQYSQLRYIENIFNESNVSGISSAITGLFNAWNKLGQQPDSLPTREALLSAADTLTSGIRSADNSMRQVEEQLDTMIRQDVDRANQLIQEIAALNTEISNTYLKGRNNPNGLMDKRDEKARELASIIDVKVEDRGPGDYSINMKNGYTLVQDNIPFSLKVQGPQVENNLTKDSPYKATGGTAYFAGADSKEYTVEMVSGGTIGTDATFRVSIDGGKTWLLDDSGNPQIFNANEQDGTVRVGKLDIWFDAGAVNAGDRFVLSPKNDVYWVSPTSGPENISPQIYGDGTDNSLRITGGSLGGLLEFRDYKIGEYRDRLDALSKSLAWEVNRIHSSGAGLEPLTSMMGTYVVGNTSAPLSSPEARFTWADRLQPGNMSFEVYGPDGSSLVPYPGIGVFSQLPGGNFDPDKHSMEDVVAAINATSFTDAAGNTITPFKATIVDGKMHIESTDPSKYTFAVTADTTGLAAGFGLNTFFTGDTAENFGVRGEFQTNLNLINAGRVNGAGEMNPGDNDTANKISELAAKAVEISTVWNKKATQTLTDYYSTLVTKVGADTSSVKFTAANETAMALDLYQRQEEVSGVNLDEEMSNLIKFQASYKAAAKLITTADEMMQTILGLKQ